MMDIGFFFSDDDFYIVYESQANETLQVQSPEMSSGSYCLQLQHITPARAGNFTINLFSEFENTSVFYSDTKVKTWERNYLNFIAHYKFQVIVPNDLLDFLITCRFFEWCNMSAL